MQFTVLGVFHFRTKLFCRKYYLQHGFGDPVDLKEGALCAVLHRQVKEFCRARIELVTSSGKVSKDSTHTFFLHTNYHLLTSWLLHVYLVNLQKSSFEKQITPTTIIHLCVLTYLCIKGLQFSRDTHALNIGNAVHAG